MKILAIETSCDETAISILSCSGDLSSLSFDVLANKVLSQIDIHKEYGGVYPTLAKREHARNLVPVLVEVLESAGYRRKEQTDVSKEISAALEEILSREPDQLKQVLSLVSQFEVPDIDALAVTEGPGLAPALWVGVNFARALAVLWNKPLIPVNHMEGHILSVLLEKSNALTFPALALLVSGGHTELVLAKSYGEYTKIGQTRDDAVGEAFDKVARMLDLPYPGGPEISRLAEHARNADLRDETITLPRPMINSDDFDFSFSGLKTAVLHLIAKVDMMENSKALIAREFEDAVVDVLIAKVEKALQHYKPKTLIVGGGVIANKHLQHSLRSLCDTHDDISLFMPPKETTTDNAIMIGITAYSMYQNDPTVLETPPEHPLEAKSNLSL